MVDGLGRDGSGRVGDHQFRGTICRYSRRSVYFPTPQYGVNIENLIRSEIVRKKGTPPVMSEGNPVCEISLGFNFQMFGFSIPYGVNRLLHCHQGICVIFMCCGVTVDQRNCKNLKIDVRKQAKLAALGSILGHPIVTRKCLTKFVSR